MRNSMKTKLLSLFALMLVMGAFLFAGATTAYAAADPTGAIGSPPIEAETLSVDEVWLTGDTLHITVTDKNGGERQTLELNLSDYAKPSDEYVTIQATDKDGRTSNSIQFKNPYYAPQTDTGNSGNPLPDEPDGGTGEPSAPSGENPVSNGRPFTPDGTGTVIDNATDGDGKEFFTVKTPDGNVFYLIVDRQRNTDNVYLLNAVSEDDLASLAKEGDGKNTGAAKPPAATAPIVPPTTTPEQTPPPAPEKSGGNTGSIVFIIIAVVVIGGAGYYFKIVRPKQNGGSAYDDDEEQEGFDENEEMDVTDDGEGDDEE